MAKFQIMSDLHQEFYGSKPIFKPEDVEAFLLLAGDLTAGSVNIEYMLNYPGARVLGNHEFYRRHWNDCITEHRLMGAGKPMQLLEDETIVHEGVRIIAATLWTDFMAPKPGTDKKEWHGFSCREMMADSHAIKLYSTRGVEERHVKSRDYIKAVLGNKHDGPTIVMTHHAPSFKSNHPKYINSAITGGFCVDLEYMIEEYQPELWVHGHCHESFDYNIGKTRVICNPGAYPGENQQFKRNLIVEV